MLYFHYAFDDFNLKQKGEPAILYGYKLVNNRRIEGKPNIRFKNIVKSNINDSVKGILYDISNSDAQKFEDSKEIEKIQVSVSKENGIIVNAFTFRAKPAWVFNNDRPKTDADVNLTGQLLGADKGVQAMRTRFTAKMETKYIKKYFEFINEILFI